MLKSLSIVNYALIENIEIGFTEGFSVITGETGAGKSIILGAFSMILGKRADLNILRNKSKKCVIEGVFDNRNLSLQKFFADNDLDYDNQTIIRREILPSGKSRAFINDTPVNLGLLVYLGNKFVNVHSQHETLQLSDASFQLNVLDDFINKPNLLTKYKNVYERYNSLTSRLEQLIELNNKAIKDEDYLKYQLEELNNVSLNTQDIDELETRAQYLEHAEEIKLALANAESILNNDESSLTNNLSELTKIVGNIQSYLPNVKTIVQRLNSLTIELKDIQDEIEIMNRDDNFDTRELQLVNEKLSAVYSLIHKHHVQTVTELINVKKEYEEKLNSISSMGEEIEAINNELSTVKKELIENANELHDVRINGCDSFSNAVLTILRQVGMKDAGFVTRIEKLPEFGIAGLDKVQFVFNANLGVEPGEIS
ncbi:MAG TPA: AAA family ATPase, partial [Bacteroidales bacterium]|nr:AAA family ATPase [Bacteroidales bacterium]